LLHLLGWKSKETQGIELGPLLLLLLLEGLLGGRLLEARLPIPAGILRIPVFSAPVALFSQESQFLFHRNFFGMSSGNLSVWGLHRKLRRISIC
jgi:hypothetical protein